MGDIKSLKYSINKVFESVVLVMCRSRQNKATFFFLGKWDEKKILIKQEFWFDPTNNN